MADLSQYASDMAYLKNKASSGTLTTKDQIYQRLKGKTSLPDLVKWLAREIDPYVKQV